MVVLAPQVHDSFSFSMDFAGALQLFPLFFALPNEPPLLSGFLLEHVDEVAGVNQLSLSLLREDPSGRRLHLLAADSIFFGLEGREIRQNHAIATN